MEEEDDYDKAVREAKDGRLGEGEKCEETLEREELEREKMEMALPLSSGGASMECFVEEGTCEGGGLGREEPTGAVPFVPCVRAVCVCCVLYMCVCACCACLLCVLYECVCVCCVRRVLCVVRCLVCAMCVAAPH